MDWEGQRRAELLMWCVVLVSAVAAFLTGYVSDSLTSVLSVYLAGVAVTFTAIVPAWPRFNRHPFTWLEPLRAEEPSQRVLARQQMQDIKSS